jgi:N utilization substance protein B
MSSRRKGRVLAFQAIYAWDVRGGAGRKAGDAPSIPEDLLMFSWLETEAREKLDEATAAFSRLLISGAIGNIDEVDGMIRAHLQNWDFSRLNRVDLALLRMSAYALMFQTDISPSIVIDEAIGIAKEFGTEESFRFVNGVLDAIRRTLADRQSGDTQAASGDLNGNNISVF